MKAYHNPNVSKLQHPFQLAYGLNAVGTHIIVSMQFDGSHIIIIKQISSHMWTSHFGPL